MAYVVVAACAANGAVLSLDVDGVGDVLGWQLVNDIQEPLFLRLTSGRFSVSQAFARGTHTGVVPRNQRWNVSDPASAVAYDLATPGGS